MNHTETIIEVERAIRAGQIPAAARLLREMKPKSLKRPLRLRYANLARRCELPHLALRALRPVVLPPKGLQEDATAEEISEYAASLLEIGATPEGLKLMSRVDPKAAPDSLLFRSFALFGEWNYGEAIPLLEQFVVLSDSPYRRLVGQVNLAAALAAVRSRERAEATLKEAIALGKELGASRLLGNCHELKAQLALDRGEFRAAEAELEESQRYLRDAGCIDEFLVAKWEAITGLRQGHPGSEERMRAIRLESEARGYWEGVRDCDFHLAVSSLDPLLLGRVFFGTPHGSFRERILRAAPDWRLPESYSFSPNPSVSSLRTFDLRDSSALAQDLGETLEGGLLSQAVRLLATDFYAPFKPASIFAALFPEEHFNDSSSPHRVHELINRVRVALAKRRGLNVAHVGHGYSLSGSATLVVPKNFSRSSADESRLDLLRGRVGVGLFSIKDASATLGVCNRTANRMLADWITRGLAERQGVGRSTQYRLTLSPGQVLQAAA